MNRLAVHWSHAIRRAACVPLLLAAVLFSGAACAEVALRVKARPITDPIQGFVTVTDANGDPINGLVAADFTVTLDGVAIPLADFSLPPAQDASQSVSVIFVMDNSGSVRGSALSEMQDAVANFIDTMAIGDFAAIIKFNESNPLQASVVQPFTEIDGAAGNSALISAVMAPYDGSGTNLLDALELAVDNFLAPPVPLPAGPKAIILISDGGENSSTAHASDIVADASGADIHIFTIAVGNFTAAGRAELMQALADETGGDYLPAPTDAEITAAYATISLLLSNEYHLTLPNIIADCGEHTLEVTVAGQAAPAAVTFSRCDTTPNPFSFSTRRNVALGAVVTSDSVVITGIDGPAPISVSGGEYSVGCSNTFTSNVGTIDDGQSVCVRHTAATAFDTEQVTKLTIGGVSANFQSRTVEEQQSGGGGGGATGGFELLLGLAALLARRRLPA